MRTVSLSQGRLSRGCYRCEVHQRSSSRLIGLPRYQSEHLFPCAREKSHPLSPKEDFLRFVLPSVSPPQSSLVSNTARVLSERALPARVSALFVTLPWRVNSPCSSRYKITRIPTLASFHPQAFAASRWFSPRQGLRACFIPQPTFRTLPVQGLLTRCSVIDSSPMSAPTPFLRDC
jgi:hypothetical protein